MATLFGNWLPANSRIAAGWQRALLCWGALLVAMALVFTPTLASLWTIWNNNVAFGHCILVPFIILWLLWLRRVELVQVRPQPYFLALLPIALMAMLWLAGWAGRINIVQHAAFIFLLQLSVPLVFGLRVTRAVLFPLLYAAFLIPAGDQAVPFLQSITAWFCYKLLALAGVPFTADGVFIHAPNGNFQVAEACSGIRYLTAMVAVAAVYANVAFKSWSRRGIVLALSIIIPIIANGIRAWAIIYLGYISDNKIAQGVDHILYGWVFFALVMILFILICRAFADRPIDEPMIDIAPIIAGQATSISAVMPWIVAVAAAIGIMVLAVYDGHRSDARPPTLTQAMIGNIGPKGWTPNLAQDRVHWTPVYENADGEKLQSYIDKAGHQVTVYVGLFLAQDERRALIRYGNGAFVFREEGDSWGWSKSLPPPSLATAPAPWSYIIYKDQVTRDVWQWYYVDGKLYGSPTTAKLAAAWARLAGQRTEVATVILSAERVSSEQSREADLAAFAQAVGPLAPALQHWIGVGGQH